MRRSVTRTKRGVVSTSGATSPLRTALEAAGTSPRVTPAPGDKPEAFQGPRNRRTICHRLQESTKEASAGMLPVSTGATRPPTAADPRGQLPSATVASVCLDRKPQPRRRLKRAVDELDSAQTQSERTDTLSMDRARQSEEISPKRSNRDTRQTDDILSQVTTDDGMHVPGTRGVTRVDLHPQRLPSGPGRQWNMPSLEKAAPTTSPDAASAANAASSGATSQELVRKLLEHESGWIRLTLGPTLPLSCQYLPLHGTAKLGRVEKLASGRYRLVFGPDDKVNDDENDHDRTSGGGGGGNDATSSAFYWLELGKLIAHPQRWWKLVRERNKKPAEDGNSEGQAPQQHLIEAGEVDTEHAGRLEANVEVTGPYTLIGVPDLAHLYTTSR